jgi:ABC-2 type transport system ATP-binding protein
LSEPAPSTPETRGVRVEARELTRRFGSCVALAGATLQIEPGETFGLLGANGAGKTTFIRIVTGCLLPSSGSIAVDGVSPAEHPTVVQSKLGFVMETSRLYPELRVTEFLRFVAGARGLRGPAKALALERSLARFQLEHVASRLIGNLSKGYQQRVSLAQAFLHDPPLLIVDEPTGGLDPVQQREVQDTLRALRGERTIILCTHDLREAERLCSHVAVLRRGQLVTRGATNEILGQDQALELFRDDSGSPA